jgi:hypothetical protein
MGTLRVTTISDTAGTGPVTLTKQSAAKAWVSFSGTGTIAARDSENVSSLTDNGTGDYTIGFTAAMDNSNYAVPTGFSGNGTNNFHALEAASFVGGVRMYGVQWGVAFYDTNLYSVSIFGDLA